MAHHHSWLQRCRIAIEVAALRPPQDQCGLSSTQERKR